LKRWVVVTCVLFGDKESIFVGKLYEIVQNSSSQTYETELNWIQT